MFGELIFVRKETAVIQKHSLYFPKEDQKLLPPMLRVDDTRCKFSLYHIAQIYMRITHYDYIIYAWGT